MIATIVLDAELIEESIKLGYLPDYFNANDGDDVTIVESGHYALSAHCITTECGTIFHAEVDEDEFCEDEFNRGAYILQSESICVYGRRGCECMTHESNEDIVEHGGSWYHVDYLEHNGLCRLHDGTICSDEDARYVNGECYHCDDCYYWECDDEYHLEPEPSRDLFGYHSQKRLDHSGDSRFKVGVEIEKEDDDELEGIDANELYNDFGFIAEEDGSLNSDGFEIVSPTLALNSETIKAFEPIRHLVNASGSHRCGGHIHFSEVGKSGEETFDEFGPLVPLLFALYPSRVSQNYCKAKKAADMKGAGSKYQAVQVLSNRIEFRIFPLVRDMDQLQWRLDLLFLWSKSKPTYRKTVRLLRDPKSWLCKHLGKVCDPSKKATQYVEQLAYWLDISQNGASRFNKFGQD